MSRWLRMFPKLRAVALGLIVLGLVSVAWATSELQDGITELPAHWWSTLATAPLVAGLVLAVVAWRVPAARLRRTG